MKHIYKVILVLCMGFSAEAKSQVVFTSLYTGVPNPCGIDLNGDGTDDFVFKHAYQPFGSFSVGAGMRMSVTVTDVNYVLYNTELGHMQVYENGDTVQVTQIHTLKGGYYGSTQPFEAFVQYTQSTMIGDYKDYIEGSVYNKYLGLAIQINGAYHYGWVKFTKLRRENVLDPLVIRAYAFNTTPSEPIVIDDPEHGSAIENEYPPGITPHDEQPGIYPNPLVAGKLLTIYSLLDLQLIEIFDINGKKVSTHYYYEVEHMKKTSFAEPALLPGMYFMRITYYNADQVPSLHKIIVQ